MLARTVFGWSSMPAGRPVRPAGFALAALAVLATAQPAHAAPAAIGASAALAAPNDAAKPDWFAQGDTRAAEALIDLLETSALDGLNPSKFSTGHLTRAMRRAESGDVDNIRLANRKFNEAFARYVTGLRANAAEGWLLVDGQLAPRTGAGMILAGAARAGDLAAYVRDMGYMHSSYAGLRQHLRNAIDSGDRQTEALVRLNMQRVRMLPASGRYILVNAAAQRLQMVDDGRVVGEMKVVVGKQKYPTPVMAAYIRYAALNPYWEVPSDLAAERIAPNVVSEGLGYLKKHGYVLLSDWGANAAVVDPSTIDWQAVADGKIQVRLRQNPGPGNSMGRMKFMFPNTQGVYLHDTPDKKLLKEDARLFSGGCVRLEDAPRLSKWMFGKTLNPKGAEPDQRVDLPEPVPVYIAYLTALPDGERLALYEDIYGRDEAALVDLQGVGKLAAF
jgi:murein L,D-transpeptidase YcbB/YkuD